MITLTVNQNQMDYIGLLDKPVFALMGEGREIIEGLYGAFALRGVTLADFRLDEVATMPSSFGVNVNLKSYGVYKLRFDRVEWSVNDFIDGQLSEFPEILRRGEDWLRSVAQDVYFKKHSFLYTGHCRLSEGTSQDFLLSFSGQEALAIGQNLGNGIIYNWFDTETGGRFQLLIDHSLTVKGGIFIQLMALFDGDRVDHSTIIATGQTSLNKALNKIGLQLEIEQEI